MGKKVSVIIPIYNIEKYLRDAIDSVLAQTYTNLDIILVDDGSADSCPAICDEYAIKDRRIRVIHKENGGLSDARNAGLSIAEGEYVYFLDGDDYIKQETINTLVNVIEREKADIVCFEWETIYEDFNDSTYKEEFVRSRSYSSSKGSELFELQLKNNDFFVPIPIQFYSSEFIEKNRLQFKKGIIHEDELFTPIAFIRAGRVACINMQLYCRRLRANSIMSMRVSFRSVDGLIICIKELIEESTKYNKADIEYRLIKKYVQIILFNIYKEYYDLENNEKKAAHSKLIELHNLLKNHKYLGSMKIFLKIKYPGFIHIYNVLKTKLKKS